MKLLHNNTTIIHFLFVLLLVITALSHHPLYAQPVPVNPEAQSTPSADSDTPDNQSFVERHRKIIDSLKILLAIVLLSYGVKFLVWLTQKILNHLSKILEVGPARFSPKRSGIMLSFAGSIIKLFIWIFGLVLVLNEFDIKPSTSTGAIGLIGLIMAGMFREIVVDFVKGLDIIAGRHYIMGDFVELDGKMGHVVDFNVKYTRIRTLAGQEFNIPNSKCVPSRRFPDGYVNNYVDIRLKNPADKDRAIKSIEPVCIDLNQRIEAVRDVPALTDQFTDPQNPLTLRYRVRVLPGCPWVITDYFLPAVKQALSESQIELASEPTFFFINRIETFRMLFSRQLSEQEIINQATQDSETPQQ